MCDYEEYDEEDYEDYCDVTGEWCSKCSHCRILDRLAVWQRRFKKFICSVITHKFKRTDILSTVGFEDIIVLRCSRCSKLKYTDSVGKKLTAERIYGIYGYLIYRYLLAEAPIYALLPKSPFTVMENK